MLNDGVHRVYYRVKAVSWIEFILLHCISTSVTSSTNAGRPRQLSDGECSLCFRAQLFQGVVVGLRTEVFLNEFF